MTTARGLLRVLVYGVLCAAVLALAGAAAASFNTARLVSVGTDTDAAVAYAGASADGSKVFFTTTDKLVAADTDTRKDVYMRAGGVTTLVTPGTTVAVTYAGGSADGSIVFITTTEGLDPSDTDGLKDIYAVSGGTYTLQTPNTLSPTALPSFSGNSADGSKVFFTTAESFDANDFETTPVNDVYQRSGGATTLLTPGTPVAAVAYEGSSADGAHVFFSTVDAIAGTGDADAVRDVYDRSGGATSLVTPGTTNAVTFAGNSADGSKVFFTTVQKLDAVNDTDALKDVYQAVAGVYTLVTPGTSLSPTDLTAVGNSADGSHVFFTTAEAIAGTGDADAAVDLYDRSGGTTTLVTPGTAAAATFDGSSADGSHVFFNSTESLDALDSDGGLDDVYDRSGGTTSLVSQPGAGAGGAAAAAAWGGTSADGGRVFFVTAEKLAGNDGDTLADVYEALTDSNAPAITPSQAPNGSNGWFRTAPAALHVSAVDDVGPATLDCTLDGSPAALANLAATQTSITGDVQTSTDGDHLVDCHAADGAHNPATMPTEHLKLDRGAPAVTPSQSPNGSNGWFKTAPATLHLVAADGLAIGVLSCTLDGSPAPLANVVPTAISIAADLQTSTPGDHTVVCTATDAAGNSAITPAQHLKLDTTGPAVTFAQTPNGSNGWFKTAPARVRATATDALAIATLTCKLDGASATLLNPAVSVTTSAGDVQTSTQGDHLVVCTGTDAAGNATVSLQQHLKLDTAVPTLTVANVTADPSGPSGVTVSAYTTSAGDATSPPAAVLCAPAAPHLFPMGDSTVSCTATDQAGNTTTRTFTVHVRTVVEQIAVLKGMVTGASPPLGGVLTPILGALLDFAALYAPNPKKKADACGKLKEFTDRIATEMLKPKPGMTAGQAASLTAYGNQIKVNLGC